MKQVARVLTSYSADLFGICSIFYELGGLVIMHDASGCNSTYNTHDEPRFYTMESMVYISGFVENDVILGNDQKLIDDILEIAEEMHPKFIAISTAMISHFMSVDVKGITRIIEKRTGIPTFGFETNAMDDYTTGGNLAYRTIASRLVKAPSEPKKVSDGPITVNLLGVTPLDFSIVGNVEALHGILESHDIRVRCCMTMGCTLEDIEGAADADVNVLCSAIALSGAKYLNEEYGTPYVTGLPVGKYATEEWVRLIRLAAETGKNQKLGFHDKTVEFNPSNSDWFDILEDIKANRSEEGEGFPAMERVRTPLGNDKRIFIVAEPVFAASLRECLRNEFDFTDVTVVCPVNQNAEMLREGDVQIKHEEDFEALFRLPDLVIADPIYRRALPKDYAGEFIGLPHEGYSGRMYRSLIPVFCGPNFSEWMARELESPLEIVSNDIMRNNRPFATKSRQV